VDPGDEGLAGALDDLSRLPHQELLDFGALPNCSVSSARSTRSTSASAPRLPRAGRIPRLPKLAVTELVRTFDGLDGLVRATATTFSRSTVSIKFVRRRSAKAYAAFKRSISSTGFCRPRHAPMTFIPPTKESHH